MIFSIVLFLKINWLPCARASFRPPDTSDTRYCVFGLLHHREKSLALGIIDSWPYLQILSKNIFSTVVLRHGCTKHDHKYFCEYLRRPRFQPTGAKYSLKIWARLPHGRRISGTKFQNGRTSRTECWASRRSRKHSR